MDSEQLHQSPQSAINGESITGSSQANLSNSQSNDQPGVKTDALSSVMEDTSGLRRSKRTPQARSRKDLIQEEEDAAAAVAAERKKLNNAKAKAKAKSKAKQVEKEQKIAEEKKEKEKLKKQKEKEKAVSSKKVQDAKNLKTSSSAKPSAQLNKEAPNLFNTNWSPNLPLYFHDYKNQISKTSRMKNPNMRALPYGGDIVKLMTFINKFYIFFDNDLLNLSFQEFEIGLDLYSVTPQELGLEFDKKRPLYQDYIPVKEVITCQDKMNLLFLTLLKLLFDKKSSKDREHRPQAVLSEVTNFKANYQPLVSQLKISASEWGYPSQWRVPLDKSINRFEPKTKAFTVIDKNPLVDSKGPEVLVENVFEWHKNLLLPLEHDPLHNPDLEKSGLLALKPHDRVILLKALTNWCLANSTKVHEEVYYLSHLRKDSNYGVPTQFVPRHLLEGSALTKSLYRKLCVMAQVRLEERVKMKHVKKQIREGKQQHLLDKLKLIKEMKEATKSMSNEEKDQWYIEEYDNWCKIFKGDLIDNPLSTSFEDESYQLRLQDFFIARIPLIGDFYLPRMHSYSDAPITVSTFTDLLTLESLCEKCANGQVDAYYLFENYGQMLSNQFKLLYHDTPAVIQDTLKGIENHDKVYWYEMCHDSESLKYFIDYLDYKIAPPPEKPDSKKRKNIEDKKDNDISMDDADIDSAQAFEKIAESTSELIDRNENTNMENSPKSKTNQTKSEISDPTINKKPLPKEYRFNQSRKKLVFLKEYLSKMYHVLKCYEDLKKQYSGMAPGKRTLRKVQKRNIQYAISGSDYEDYEHDASDSYEEHEEEEDIENYDDSDAAEEFEVPTGSRAGRRKRPRN